MSRSLNASMAVHLVRGGQVGRVVDHGNQVLHLGSSPVFGAPLAGGAHPCYEHHWPRSDTAYRIPSRTFSYAGGERSDSDGILLRHVLEVGVAVSYCGRPAGRYT
jgi:hypothetical protein